jgi:hypothetical protein
MLLTYRHGLDLDDDMTSQHDYEGCEILRNEIVEGCYLCKNYKTCLEADKANNRSWIN